MTKKLNDDDDLFEIRSDIPIPPQVKKTGPLTRTLMKMTVGQCIDIPVTVSRARIYQATFFARANVKTRRVTNEQGEEVFRVWKVGNKA